MSDGMLLDRIPPQNLDAERSTLGAMFLEKEAIYRAMEILRPEDFYKDAHRLIYQTVLDLTNRGEPVDLVTVTEELRQKDLMEKIGGVTYLTELAGSVPDRRPCRILCPDCGGKIAASAVNSRGDGDRVLRVRWPG